MKTVIITKHNIFLNNKLYTKPNIHSSGKIGKYSLLYCMVEVDTVKDFKMMSWKYP